MPNNLKTKVDELERQVSDLVALVATLQSKLETHEHNGVTGTRVNFDDVIGNIDTVSAVPTHVPRDFNEQIVFYVSGATYRLYWYDFTNKAWRYAAFT